MSKVYFVTDTETTGPAFAIHNMYQMATMPVLADGTVLQGMSCNLAFSTEQHDPDTLDFLKRVWDSLRSSGCNVTTCLDQ